MKLLTKEVVSRLPKLYATDNIKFNDKVLQVKFFTPDGDHTWYGVEYDGNDTFFGLVVNSATGNEGEWGYFSKSELKSIRGRLCLPVERDMYFDPMTYGQLVGSNNMNSDGSTNTDIMDDTAAKS